MEEIYVFLSVNALTSVYTWNELAIKEKFNCYLEDYMLWKYMFLLRELNERKPNI